MIFWSMQYFISTLIQQSEQFYFKLYEKILLVGSWNTTHRFFPQRKDLVKNFHANFFSNLNLNNFWKIAPKNLICRLNLKYKWKSQFWIGLGPIALDFPYISEELTDKSNSELWFSLVADNNIFSTNCQPSRCI